MATALEQVWPGAPEPLLTHQTCTGLGWRCPDVSDSVDALKVCQIQTRTVCSLPHWGQYDVSTLCEQLLIQPFSPHSREAGLCQGASL